MEFELTLKDLQIKNIITFYKIKGNIIHVNINSHELIIKCPKNSKEFFIIDCDNYVLDWLDEINIKIIQKKLTIENILDLLIKKSNEITPQELVDDIDFGYEKGLDIDRYDIEYYKKKNQIEKYISSSKSLISSEKSGLNKLFDSRIVSSVIVGEFMNTWKEFKNSEKIKIDIKDNNIYTWNIKISKFNNKSISDSLQKINEHYGYNYIEFDILFHDKLYPNYPPIIKILRPRLNNLLMHKFANCKMISLDYWTPARDCIFIINKMYKLLDKHADINIETELNDKNKYSEGAFVKLEDHLLKITSLTNPKQDDDLDDQVYESIKECIQKKDQELNKSNSTCLTKGIGYGFAGCSVWNIDAYLKSQQEKDEQIILVLKKIIQELQETNNEQLELLYNLINQSYLVPYLKSMIQSTSLLEITNHLELYKNIFNLILILANERAIYIFYEKEKDLFSCISEISNVCRTAVILDKNSVDEIVNTIISTYETLKIPYDNYKQQMIHMENEKKI